MEEEACNVASFVADPLQVYITGPSIVLEGDSDTWCANISNCSGAATKTWEVSTNGWSYSFAGSGNCITQQINSDDLYLKLTVTCDGQTVTTFKTVFAEGGGGDVRIASPITDSPILTESKNITKINKLTVFPNPAKEELSINFVNLSKGNVRIYLTDMLGKRSLIFDLKDLDAGKQSLLKSLKDTNSGIYTLTVHTEDKIESKQIIISNGK